MRLPRLAQIVAVAVLTSALPAVVPSPASADTGCPTVAVFPSGSGSSGSPYVIATPGNLQYLRETPAIWDDNLYFSLSADISMTGCSWTSGLGQTSVNSNGFRGWIDGNGHVISGLTITTTEPIVGFISTYSAGSIEDLGLQGTMTVTINASGTSGPNVGALVGSSMAGSASIRRSYTDVDITVNASVQEAYVFAGWGYAYTSQLQASVGGIMGSQGATTIEDSYARGDVTVTASATKPVGGTSTPTVQLHTGGVVGNANSPVTKTYSTGHIATTVTATVQDLRIGAFIGRSGDPSTGSVWDTTTSGMVSPGVGMVVGSPTLPTGLVTSAMKQIASYPTWSISSTYDATATWVICPGANDGYPALMAMQSTDVCSSPDATSVTPSSGPIAGGTSITISGTALSNASSVTIGGSPATIVTKSSTAITATTPAGTAGAADVVVTTPNGSDTLASGFTYEAPQQQDSGTSPSPSQASPSATTTPTTPTTPAATSTPAPTTPSIVPEPLNQPPATGTATSVVDGEPTTSTVTRTERTTTVTTPATGTAFSLTSPPATGDAVAPGVPMRFEFTGGQPGSPVTIHAMSDPVLVATAIADASGKVSGYITLPHSLPEGHHSLVVSGYSATGTPVSSYLGVEVVAPPAKTHAVILFGFQSTSLSSKGRTTLDTLVAHAQGRTPTTITVGALRAVGATSADRQLAIARARKVASYLRSAGMPGTVRIGTSIPTRLTTAAARRVDVTVTYP